MIPDQQTQIALALLVIFLTIYLVDKYWTRFMKWKEFTDSYKKEIDDILNKEEFKVKGRYE